MSLSILYRHPHRLDEAGMTLVANQAEAVAKKDQLEHRGFLVIEIVNVPFARPTPTS